ncbi:hypothetical protein HUW66_009990 [Staphylococcus epidermidis]|nr:hypothetical protein [Staphylococcus epidermidis]MDE4585887.1 hypothetical protein [Staphylococcus epidermidis]TES18747.1 hypothetical protein E1N03_12170 [Staphylococcus epidermidis]
MSLAQILIRFSKFRTPLYFILLISSLVLAYVFSIVGYIGLFIVIVLLIRWIYTETTQKILM